MTEIAYDAWEIGTASISVRTEMHSCKFRLGRITSGKQKVLQGFFIALTLPNGDIVRGEDRRSLRKALFQAAEILSEKGMILCAVGLSNRFSENEESRNTGMGFVPASDRAVHMLSFRLGGSEND
ncbi:hypothetical protein [Novosphingobium terrae]|jgi:hypothetical protein|uniref:hypothetical protein n=1 Tax=Novosphingobium terrae TaxID=2726189 RepID=UPI00197DF329|nr:hypothetical protein [Novosphingobium terrae]